MRRGLLTAGMPTFFGATRRSVRLVDGCSAEEHQTEIAMDARIETPPALGGSRKARKEVNPSGRHGDPLQARGDNDAVAHQIAVALLHDVAYAECPQYTPLHSSASHEEPFSAHCIATRTVHGADSPWLITQRELDDNNIARALPNPQ